MLILIAVLLLVLLAGLGITQVLTINWTRQGEAIANNVSLTSSAELNIDETVPGSGNVVVNAAIDVSVLSVIYISCDGDIVITTNDDGSPDNTLTLKAGKPLLWYTGCGLANPLTVDVITFKATKATPVDANLKVRLLFDATP